MRTRAGVVALSIVVVVAACGDSGGGARSGADYVKEAGATCKAFTHRTETLLAGIDLFDDAKVRHVARRYAELEHDTARELRAIGYPKGLKPQADAFYDQLDRWGDEVARDPNLFRGRDAPAAFTQVANRAREVGLAGCGERS